MKKWFKGIFAALTVVAGTVLTGVGLSGAALPDSFLTTDLAVSVEASPTMTVTPGKTVNAAAATAVGGYTGTAKWLGVFPVKTVRVQQVARKTVAIGGVPFGLKMYADGVMVVGLADVDTAAGGDNPAAAAGVRIGDVILRINETPVSDNDQVATLIESSEGAVRLWLRRNGREFSASFTPLRSASEGRRKAGIWVRDSSAGIGTLTFFDPSTGRFAGLGHAVCDVDTGAVIPLAAGEIVPARIVGVRRGSRGAPGELQGVFDGESIGWLDGNSEQGVFGTFSRLPDDPQTVEVALKQEIRTGDAEILATVDGNEPRRYAVRIQRVNLRDGDSTRHMMLTVTDPELLEKTGGIVQGMSGSPILQNGRLVGAVTHVLVGDPTVGYGIFAETMLERAKK